ncbi:MdtA/MuxA family multidrug efflux RND transporter periplasmic adaptor subunit [Candidatus Dactylopiibacterium carminicum]|uniref:MdtA/MuxA family multidrug efflux RND transporter periplasmic adaptor subunit n=1 Tax=Candidatus Dactylopiibacterium carminicum TaxID=857335 RepID=UPI001CC2ACDD|nr:MdtA/MuxA family multidrug efflux RND transporter periplasmic adaptor subunit [Candidatus Dactylopiibacterium carminicum]
MLLLLVLVLVLTGAGGWWWYRGHKAQPAETAAKPKRIVPVQIGTVGEDDIRVFYSSLGTVTASSSVIVRSRIDGYVTKLGFKEGDSVETGQLLAEIDTRPYKIQLTQAEGQLAKDQAQLANARNDLARYQGLLAEDSIARQQVDTQQTLVRQLEGTVKADQAQVESARLQLTYARVTAPAAGRLGLRNVDIGSLVRSSETGGLVTINQMQPINVLFTLPEAQVPLILDALHAGKKVRVEAWDRERKQQLAVGRIAAADNQIDTVTGTLKLKAIFPNKDEKLFPNQFVNVRVLAETHKGVTVVPTAAIQRGRDGAFVYLVKDEGVATLRRVTLGPTEGSLNEVLKGLEPGDAVVTDGIDQLREGTRVEVANPGDLLKRKSKKKKNVPAAQSAPSAPDDKTQRHAATGAEETRQPPRSESSAPTDRQHRQSRADANG